MVSRLFRPRTERMIAGVCSGLGLYFGLDPVIIRLLFVVLALTTGLTLILYPILWVVMPSAPAGQPLPLDARFDPQTGAPLPPEYTTTGQTIRLPSGTEPPPVAARKRVLAFVLVGVGGLLLLGKLGELIGIDLAEVAIPLLLVGLGIHLLRGARTSRQ